MTSGERLLGHRGARAGIALLGVLVAGALLGGLIAGADPNVSDFAAGRAADGTPIGVSAAHFLGTDPLFRDELARLAAGARLSLLVAIVSTAISTVIGATVGIVAGWVAGTRWAIVDGALMRLVDVLLSFPYLLLVMAIGAAVDATSAATVLVVLGATSWLGTARLLRAKTMQLRELGYIDAARALGQPAPSILWRHVLPNVSGTLVVVATSSMAGMILAESTLSYLQVGVPPPAATWGRMLYEGQRWVTVMPRLTLLPGAAILASVLGFNLLGEALRDVLDTREVRR